MYFMLGLYNSFDRYVTPVIDISRNPLGARYYTDIHRQNAMYICMPNEFHVTFPRVCPSPHLRWIFSRRPYPHRGSPRLAAIFAALEARAPREHTRPVSVSQNVVLRRLCAAWPTYPR